MNQIELFICYSHRDKYWRNKLEIHLLPLRRSGTISWWHDRKIAAGAEWEHEIDSHLAAADIILLLVSQDLIASDYCWGREIKETLDRHERGEARVIPIILTPCSWGDTPFGRLQALPRDARPVSSW